MAASTEAKNPVGATKKTIRILEALKQFDGARVTDLAKELNFSKGTVHNHLSTLEESEFVVKNGSTYQLSLRFLTLGEYARQQRPLLEVARPEIDTLAEKTGEIANLMIEEHGRGIYLYISRGNKAVNLDTYVGTRQFLHTSAVGKAILANMTEDKLEEVIEHHGLPAETPNTVTNEEALQDELEEIRERGVAFDGEERAEGIRCVAAPISDKNGNLLAGVSVTGPSPRMKGSRFREEIPDMVQNTATVIGLNASYS
jgi:DNA-binding IclR family transcriptional regulator